MYKHAILKAFVILGLQTFLLSVSAQSPDSLKRIGQPPEAGQIISLDAPHLRWQGELSPQSKAVPYQEIEWIKDQTSVEIIYAAPDSLQAQSSYASYPQWIEQLQQKPPLQLLHTKVILPDLEFQSGTASMSANSKAQIQALAQKLQIFAGGQWSLVGFTDSTGSEAVNQKLSLARAEAVKDLMIEAGLPKEAFRAAGLGKANPIADNKTSEGRAQNRRVELQLMGISGVRIHYFDPTLSMAAVPNATTPAPTDSADDLGPRKMPSPISRPQYSMKVGERFWEIQVGGIASYPTGTMIDLLKADLAFADSALGDSYNMQVRRIPYPTVSGGIQVGVPMNKRLAIGSGILYRQIGYELRFNTSYNDSEFQYDEYVETRQRLWVHSLDVPLWMSYEPVPSLRFRAAWHLGFSLSRFTFSEVESQTDILLNGIKDDEWSRPSEINRQFEPEVGRWYLPSWALSAEYLMGPRISLGLSLQRHTKTFNLADGLLQSVATQVYFNFRFISKDSPSNPNSN